MKSFLWELYFSLDREPCLHTWLKGQIHKAIFYLYEHGF